MVSIEMHFLSLSLISLIVIAITYYTGRIVGNRSGIRYGISSTLDYFEKSGIIEYDSEDGGAKINIRTTIKNDDTKD